MPVDTYKSYELPARRVTAGPRHHFFGYYDKSPWDFEERHMLALEVPFADRATAEDDSATIGLIDTEGDSDFRPVAETRAWNWQQGCMLQWLPNTTRRLVIYNDREHGRFEAVICDVEGGDNYVLPLPIYTVSGDGEFALTLNFARLARTRPGYGYVGVPDPWVGEKAPREDGIYRLDLASGGSELIASIDQMAGFNPRQDMEKAVQWFNHLLLSPDDRRFIFLHRWAPRAGDPWKTRLFTADVDGGDIYLLADDDLVSHFDWCDPNHILAWARRKGVGDHYILFTDRGSDYRIIGKDILTSDGHCSYSPDRRWILTDTYPDREHKRRLLLYSPERGELMEIGRFYSQPDLVGEIRCDLHPRWSRGGSQVCIDSAHEGSRQMYILDVSEFIGGRQAPCNLG